MDHNVISELMTVHVQRVMERRMLNKTVRDKLKGLNSGTSQSKRYHIEN